MHRLYNYMQIAVKQGLDVYIKLYIVLFWLISVLQLLQLLELYAATISWPDQFWNHQWTLRAKLVNYGTILLVEYRVT